MSTSPKTVTIGTFAPGMDNRRPDFSLRTKEGYLQRDAVNIDLTASGSIKRRRGYTLKVAGIDSRSIWSDGDDAFYVEGENLYSLAKPAGVLTSTLVTTGLSSGQPVSFWTAPNGGVYWSDGRRLEQIISGASKPLVPTLATVPGLDTGAAGLLPAGNYLVCFTSLDAAGHESAASHPAAFTLPANGGIAFPYLDLLSTGVRINVYMSTVGGETMYRAAQITGPGAITVVSPPTGPQCQTVGLQPMPAGQIVRSFGGRLLVANGSTLFYSEPFMPGLYNPTSGFIQFPEPVTILEVMTGASPADNGLFLAADQTYWLDAAFPDCALRAVLPYGAIAGSNVSRPDIALVNWMSVRGLVEGNSGGAVKNLQEEHVAITPSATAASLLRDANGVKQAIVSLFGSRPLSLANASSYMEAEIVHRGTP
jgi:hypothetical protein